MLKLTNRDWEKRIEKQFETGLFDRIEVTKDVSKHEICNFEYHLYGDKSELALPMDIDLNFPTNHNLFENENSLDNVAPYSLFYIRKNVLNLNVVINNLVFGPEFRIINVELIEALDYVYNEARSYYKGLEKGIIKVNVFSLYKMGE